jgi:coproporphyrinogen III oxidase
MRERVAEYLQSLQTTLCGGIEAVSGETARFGDDRWTREGGGGGRSRVLTDGSVFEKAGVGFSEVHGDLPADLAKTLPGKGTRFYATGVSLVFHPRSPMVPTVHANFRYLEMESAAWFGGGADLTPYYLYREDAVHFHSVWQDACKGYAPDAYARFKHNCDDYFYLPHRDETRGVGGIFFDYLKDDLPHVFAFVRRCGDAFLSAYVPIVERRKGLPYGDAERQWQLYRRGRYVEFNLLYDRGTVFGLKTGGRTESILMSLPPLVRWSYDQHPAPGSREAELVANLKAQDWLG